MNMHVTFIYTYIYLYVSIVSKVLGQVMNLMNLSIGITLVSPEWASLLCLQNGHQCESPALALLRLSTLIFTYPYDIEVEHKESRVEMCYDSK